MKAGTSISGMTGLSYKGVKGIKKMHLCGNTIQKGGT
jgi:hypothetical protein